MSNHYESLHVTEDAPDEVIRAAYRALSLKHHPDKVGDRPQSKWKMQRINDAYAVLSDVGKRSDYDDSLRRHRHTVRSGNAVPIQMEAPTMQHQVRRRRRTPPWLREALGWLSDARLALPSVAIIWLVIYWMVIKK